MSKNLRTAESQARYEQTLALNQGKDLREEEVVHEFEDFLVVVNRFPHDRIAAVHHLLVPKRTVSDIQHLTSEEELELKYEIEDWCRDKYDCVKRNYPSTISVKHLLHWHLYVYKEEI